MRLDRAVVGRRAVRACDPGAGELGSAHQVEHPADLLADDDGARPVTGVDASYLGRGTAVPSIGDEVDGSSPPGTGTTTVPAAPPRSG